jgi:hypothetical protein
MFNNITILSLFALRLTKKFYGYCCLLPMITLLPLAFVKNRISLKGLLGISPHFYSYDLPLKPPNPFLISQSLRSPSLFLSLSQTDASPVGVVLLRKRWRFDSCSSSLNRSGGWAPTSAVWKIDFSLF